MVFWCSELQPSPTMNRQDKQNLTISGAFRLRGWKLNWQHAFKRGHGATGHTYCRANVGCHCSPSVYFGYILGLFGQSFTLGGFLWLKGSRFCCQLGFFHCCIQWFYFLLSSACFLSTCQYFFQSLFTILIIYLISLLSVWIQIFIAGSF